MKHHDSHMAHKGYVQGDMNPHVEDYQRPHSDYSQEQFGSTLNYIGRQDKHRSKEASDIKKQAYQGRYN